MSSHCRDVLREMFGSEHGTFELVAQRLRPEPRYFSKGFGNSAERWPYLREALWRLPRPMILYVTRPIDADLLCERLRHEEGFERVACFTGDTKRGERRELLDAWREQGIDLMVATSAFGVGVDKADVRSVIHACYPENLDRYYQEVGRSGRDGYSSVCLLLPTARDRRVARTLGTKLLRDERTIRQRWEAMFARGKEAPGEEARGRWAGTRR